MAMAVRPRPPGDKTRWWKYAASIAAATIVVAAFCVIVAVVS